MNVQSGPGLGLHQDFLKSYVALAARFVLKSLRDYPEIFRDNKRGPFLILFGLSLNQSLVTLKTRFVGKMSAFCRVIL